MEDLHEFDSSDGQSKTADPVAKETHKGRAADNTKGQLEIPQFVTKVEAINAVMQQMQGLSKEKIADVFKGMTDATNFDDSKAKATRRKGGSAQDAPQSAGQQISQTRISPTSASGTYKEDMDVLFGGEELSEEVREKAATIFEAAVNARLVSEIARIEEQFNERIVEELEEKIEQLEENVDKYLSYAVDQWAEDNEIAIESGLKSEVVEGFIQGLKGLFEENYVDIPDDKIDLVSELSQQVAELEEKVNAVVTENFELRDYVDTLEVEQVFAEAVEALPLTQADKLRNLVEGIEYTDVEEFTKKLNIIKETYFSSDIKKPLTSINEEVDYDSEEQETVVASGTMSHYVKAISNTSKK
jgi:flagellar motor protein MotB